MSCPQAFYQWHQTIAVRLPHLTKSQAHVLALWSWGMVLARSCALNAVSYALCEAMERRYLSVRSQLREWYCPAQAKKGKNRCDWEVASCFAPLMGWVLSLWQGRQIALALDATTLSDRFVVLCVSVLYRGCAIPVAWKVLPFGQKHPWRKEWLRLLRQLKCALPADYCVIVLADRGLYARWLFRRIVRLGWHPFLRVNKGGTFCPQGAPRDKMACFVAQVGGCWSGRGRAFCGQKRELDCTLLACWEKGCAEPWLILTDVPPVTGSAAWYGLRAWIEQGFKITKRGGWQWQRTQMRDAQRAERLWLAVAVATLWVLAVGGEAEVKAIQEMQLEPPSVCSYVCSQATLRRQGQAWQARLVSVFRRGCMRLLLALFKEQSLPQGSFWPEPWPSFTQWQEGKFEPL